MNSVDAAVGRNVRALREIAGMSQAGLSRAINIPLEKLANAERGEARLSADALFHISAALRVPISRIMNAGDPDGRESVSAEAVEDSSEGLAGRGR